MTLRKLFKRGYLTNVTYKKNKVTISTLTLSRLLSDYEDAGVMKERNRILSEFASQGKLYGETASIIMDRYYEEKSYAD